MIEVAIILVFVAYISFIVAVIFGNLKYNKLHADPKLKAHLLLDVIVPFKNESSNLDRFFTHLSQQSYPTANYTVYFVNDNSSDNSMAKVEAFCKDKPNCFVLYNSGKGKKQALITAFKQSVNDVIVLTDADTQCDKDWLLAHAKHHEKHNSDLLVGGVCMTTNRYGVWNLLQLLEYKSIEASTIGMAALNKPLMCSAANLSFRRTAVNDFERALNLKYASGDDMFLLQYLKRNKKKIDVLKHANASVFIEPEAFKNFIRQRIRWTGKGKAFSDALTVSVGVIVLLVNFLSALGMVYMAVSYSFNLVLSVLLGIKFIVDLLALLSRMSKHDLRMLCVFPLIFVLHPFYVVFTTAVGFILTSKIKPKARV